MRPGVSDSQGLCEGTKHMEVCWTRSGSSVGEETEARKRGLKAKMSALGLCASVWGAVKKQIRCACLYRVFVSNFRSIFYITNSNPLSVISTTHIFHSKSLVFLFWPGAFMLCKCFHFYSVKCINVAHYHVWISSHGEVFTIPVMEDFPPVLF